MATKKFVYVKKADTLTSALLTTYDKSIVFIEDTNLIFTHGKFFGVSTTDLNNLKNIKSFSVVSDGSTTASAPAANSTLKFKGTGGTTVTVSAEGVNIDSHTCTLTTGTTNGTVKFDNTDVKVKGIDTAAYHPDTYFATASDLNTTNGEVAKRVKSVSSGSAGIKIGGTATDPTVGLQFNSEVGNVTFTETAGKGLSGNVVIPAATVTGVSSSDKILSLNDTLLSATVGIEYNKDTKVINLTGKGHTTQNPVILGTISAADFVKDGMLDTVKLIYKNADGKEASVPTTEYTPYLRFTFNTDSGKSTIEVDMTNLVDVYTGANVYLKSINVSASYVAPANNDSVDTAIGKLAAGVAMAASSGVTSFGTKTGAITLNSGSTTTGVVNFAMNDNKLTGTAYNVASAALGTKADTALQSISASSTTPTYITATQNTKSDTTQSISVGAKIQAVDTASSEANGLAASLDVKNYVDTLRNDLDWEEL